MASAGAYPADRAAAHLTALRGRRALPISFPDDLRPRTIDEAYAVQAAVAALTPSGQRPAAYKVACRTAESQQRFGVAEAVMAPIRRDRVHPSGIVLELSQDVATGLECEVALGLEREGPALRVTSALPALEVIEQRYADETRELFTTMVADGLYNAGCVLGEPLEQLEQLNLGDIEVRVTVDGVEVARTPVGARAGDPRAAVGDLEAALARKDEPLPARTVLLTGSVTGEHWLRRGQTLLADFGVLGRVGATIG